MDLSAGEGRLTTYAVCGCSSGAVGQADSAVWLAPSSYQKRLLFTNATDSFSDRELTRMATDKTAIELQRRCSGDRCCGSISGMSGTSDAKFAINEGEVSCVGTGGYSYVQHNTKGELWQNSRT